MGLLLAPATLASLGFWFQHLQTKAKEAKESADKKAADAKAKADQEATAYQAEQVRERAADQQREEALQNYLNYLSELLVDKQLKQVLLSRKEKSEDEAATSTTVSPSIDAEAALNVIKARTLSLLRMFDQDIPRKASILSFLGDAKLLTDLRLDLERSNWENASLNYANLSDANLSFANLSFASLSFASLRRAVLLDANLSSADLMGADLQDVKLNNADLSHANLSHANLLRVNLSGANLSDTDLRGVNLSCASLSNANLSNTNLRFAKNLIPEQVKQAKNWEKAKYDEEFRAQLGLPPEPAK